MMKRWLVACVGAGIAAAGCQEQGPGDQATVVISVSLPTTAPGGTLTAYTRANRVVIRFSDAGGVRHEQKLRFDPAINSIRVAVEVREPAETLTLDLELQQDAQPLFRGTASIILWRRRNDIEVPLQPVAARVVCTGSRIELTSYGDTVQLTGAALFATGDTVRNVTLVWSASPTFVVSVDSTSGVVTALQDGTATVSCTASGATDTREVRVFAVVSTIGVAPSTAHIAIGGTEAFAATLRDARGNIIITRTPTWASSDTNVASIDASGIVRGNASGSALIIARSGSATGSSTVTVGTLPSIRLATDTASYRTIEGNVDLPPRSISITNGGGGPLSGLAVSVPGQPSWITASLTSTTAPSTLTLAVNSVNLPVGVHTAIVNVTADDADNSPQIVTVTMIVGGLPTVTTLAATDIGPTSATLNGIVKPNGRPSIAWFEWGLEATRAINDTPDQGIGEGFDPVPVSARLENLVPGTTYYFNVAAANLSGRPRGTILSFTTSAAPPSTATVDCAVRERRDFQRSDRLADRCAVANGPDHERR